MWWLVGAMGSGTFLFSINFTQYQAVRLMPPPACAG